MNDRKDWKRTDETEIDLPVILHMLCKQWKQVLACALVSAVLAGGYGYIKHTGSVRPLDGSEMEDIELTETELQSIQSAVELAAEMKGLREYVDGSVLMQIDPYHKYKICMLYSIEGAKRQDIHKITESYFNFISNGGAAAALKESGGRWNMDERYLAEIMQVYQGSVRYSYQMTADTDDSSSMAEPVFYTEVTGTDKKMAEKMAADLQNILTEYHKKVKKRVGSHTLKMLSAEMKIQADSSLQAQQRERRAQLKADTDSLKAMTDAFSDKQMAVYKKEAELEEERSESNGKDKTDPAAGQEDTESYERPGIIMKYILCGLAGGIFVYCGIYACWYLFRDTVKSEEEMKDFYLFPYYGGIALGKEEAAKGRKQHAMQKDSGQSGVQLLNRIRLACKKQGIVKLCAVSAHSLNVQEKECLQQMAEQLQAWGIQTLIAENASGDTALWDTLAETGNVLLVCRIGTTTHRMIDDEMSFYQENGIAVIGAMAFA